MRLRDLLAVELSRKQRVNQAYSLRSFARSLGVHHSTLVRILCGSTYPTRHCTRRICDRLKVDSEMLAKVMSAEAAAALDRSLIRADFRPDSRWIATVTGMPLDEVNITLHDMLASGRLAMKTPSRWVSTSRKPRP